MKSKDKFRKVKRLRPLNAEEKHILEGLLADAEKKLKSAHKKIARLESEKANIEYDYRRLLYNDRVYTTTEQVMDHRIDARIVQGRALPPIFNPH